MIRARSLGLLILGLLFPGAARAEGRALMVEVEGAGWSAEATSELRVKLVAAGFSLVGARVAAPAPTQTEVDPEPFQSLSKAGLVALARGQLAEADALLVQALEGLGEPRTRALEDGALAACLDRARIARQREGGDAAAARVEACRRAFPFGEVDTRRAPPEIVDALSAVDDRRVEIALEGAPRGCGLTFADGEPIAAPAALAETEVTLRIECDAGLVYSRRTRIDDDGVVDVRPSLEERLVAGSPPRLVTEDPREDARALAAAHRATVFLLSRSDAGLSIVRASAVGTDTFAGSKMIARAARPAGRRAARLRRAAVWTLAGAGAAASLSAIAPLRVRVNTLDTIAETPYHEPEFLSLRARFDGARVPLRLLSGLGAAGGVAAGALGRPLPRGWAIAVGAGAAALATAGAASLAVAPSCGPSQEPMPCLAREVHHDRAWLLMMAAAPLMTASLRGLFAPGRVVALAAGPSSVMVSLHLSRPLSTSWDKPAR